jgi:hypothetical protein
LNEDHCQCSCMGCEIQEAGFWMAVNDLVGSTENYLMMIGDAYQPICQGVTKAGEPCGLAVKKDRSDGGYCRFHRDQMKQTEQMT